MGREPEMHEPVGHLLQYHLWPGTSEMDMPPMEILGTEKEARLLQEYRSTMEAEDPRVRMGGLFTGDVPY